MKLRNMLFNLKCMIRNTVSVDALCYLINLARANYWVYR